MLQILTLTANISRMQVPQDFSSGIIAYHRVGGLRDSPTLPYIYITLQKAQKLSPGKVLCIIYLIALIFAGFLTQNVFANYRTSLSKWDTKMAKTTSA